MTTSTTEIIYLNGNFIPLSQAKVSVMDRGFLFGDGVYEVIPVYNGRLFLLEEHLQRLQYSLDSIYMTLPVSKTQLMTIIEQLLQRNPSHPLQTVYIEITRGVASKREHAINQTYEATLFMRVQTVLPNSQKTIKAITLEDLRWECCDIKAINRLSNILMTERAKLAGCDEAIIVKNDFVLEGATSNVFIVKDNVIKTANLSKRVLTGVTRNLVIDLAKANKIACELKDITLTELLAADEAWITSTSREILAVIEVNGQRIGDGKIGPMRDRLLKIYQDFVKSY